MSLRVAVPQVSVAPDDNQKGHVDGSMTHPLGVPPGTAATACARYPEGARCLTLEGPHACCRSLSLLCVALGLVTSMSPTWAESVPVPAAGRSRLLSPRPRRGTEATGSFYYTPRSHGRPRRRHRGHQDASTGRERDGACHGHHRGRHQGRRADRAVQGALPGRAADVGDAAWQRAGPQRGEDAPDSPHPAVGQRRVAHDRADEGEAHRHLPDRDARIGRPDARQGAGPGEQVRRQARGCAPGPARSGSAPPRRSRRLKMMDTAQDWTWLSDAHIRWAKCGLTWAYRARPVATPGRRATRGVPSRRWMHRRPSASGRCRPRPRPTSRSGGATPQQDSGLAGGTLGYASR